MNFTKLHIAGNDYICINCFEEMIENASQLSVRLCDRHFGAGADGLVLIADSYSADFIIRQYAPDGVEAEVDANAVISAGKYVYDSKLTEKTGIVFETLSETIKVNLYTENGIVKAAKVSLGEPVLSPQLIPVDYSGEEFIDRVVEIDGEEYALTCVGFGEGYAVLFVDDIADVNIFKTAPKIENNLIFPNGTNVVFVQVMNEENIRIRVWKKLTGEVLSYASAAVSATVASVLCGKTKRSVTVSSVGGDMAVTWNDDDTVFVTGATQKVYDGSIEI